MLTVTTSWDDGDVLDLKLANLLDRYNIKGTFYVAKEYRKKRLSDEEIKTLSHKHEIGAHTLTHPDLCTLSPADQMAEISGSKKWLEGVLGHDVSMFCYPSGRYDKYSVQAVKEAGFRGARTVEFGHIDLPSDAYRMPTTLHVYPMPFRKTGPHSYWWGKLLEPFVQRSSTLRAMGVPLSAFRSFEVTACAAFDIAIKRGKVFHLWGHSWEIEKYNMWRPLERVLSYIGKRDDCQYVTNGELIQRI